MKKPKFRLLSKVVFFYLLITLASFLISILILQKEANKHMHNILETRFEFRERFIEKLLEDNPEKISRFEHTHVKKVSQIPENFSPIYTDTIILNPQNEREDIYRKKISYLTVGDEYYRLEMFKEAEELYRFRDDVFEIIIPILAILVVVIVLANYLLSGYLLEPFRRILKQMSRYNIGQSRNTNHINTSTREFQQLIDLYEKMKVRIEEDYYQLKEYTENMSHELQTPLTIIQNKTESLLSENKLTESQVKKVKIIYDEIQQLSKLGSALNLITKIENKEFQDIQTTYTAQKIRDHIEKIREIAEMKDQNIDASLDEKHSFTMDPQLLDIMIRNLVKNALRYSYPDTTINIRTEKDKFSITNRGKELDFPGNEIFNRFKKGNEKQSIGLGLSIVKKICDVSNLEINYHYEDEFHSFEIYPVRK